MALSFERMVRDLREAPFYEDFLAYLVHRQSVLDHRVAIGALARVEQSKVQKLAARIKWWIVAFTLCDVPASENEAGHNDFLPAVCTLAMACSLISDLLLLSELAVFTEDELILASAEGRELPKVEPSFFETDSAGFMSHYFFACAEIESDSKVRARKLGQVLGRSLDDLLDAFGDLESGE